MPRRKAGETRTRHATSGAPFVQLDYLYVPTKDVAAEIEYFTGVLGAQLAFSIEGMGARVAMLRMTEGPPYVLLTDHLEGDRPVMIYRVADLDLALADLRARGWKKAKNLEIPMGPCCSFTTPGGHRIAVYELTRPEVANHFLGRRDF
ncbi:MAG: hypothetical protein M3082_13840 [Candidatus Dormibacteraeota bacterium]|nr:hypothetical protein [Candidatus Dormibacteraeota bacterium]